MGEISSLVGEVSSLVGEVSYLVGEVSLLVGEISSLIGEISSQFLGEDWELHIGPVWYDSVTPKPITYIVKFKKIKIFECYLKASSIVLEMYLIKSCITCFTEKNSEGILP